MKVALIGASGRVGTRILAELLSRGHRVTGIVRHPGKLEPHDGLTPRQGDALDEDGLVALLRGHDAVISSVRFADTDPRKLINAVKNSGVPRYLVVGGAGSLEVVDGGQLLDTPGFPDAYKPEAKAGRHFLNELIRDPVLDWTFLSPSAVFEPGERTGSFRLGTDELLVAEDGKSRISFEDFAIAMVDELEDPHHSRERFTVGY